MKSVRQYNKLLRPLSAATLGALTSIGLAAEMGDYQAALADLEANWSTLETYCTECHNFEDFAGGLDFTLVRPQDVVEDAAAFELVLRKLRNSVMPPPSQEQPPLENAGTWSPAWKSAGRSRKTGAPSRANWPAPSEQNRIRQCDL